MNGFIAHGTNYNRSAVTRQEQEGPETWCYFDVSFANLAELRSFYSDQNATVNRLEVLNGTFYYDVFMDMSSDEMASTSGYPFTMTWNVTLPARSRPIILTPPAVKP